MKDTIIPFMSKSCLVMSDFNIQNTETRLQDVMTHRCQPLRFFRNFYEFQAKITVLRSTVYLLRISDYCRLGTVLHLNIIVII
jgi:hypothetical protein